MKRLVKVLVALSLAAAMLALAGMRAAHGSPARSYLHPAGHAERRNIPLSFGEPERERGAA